MSRDAVRWIFTRSPVALLMRLKGIGAEFAAVLYLEGLMSLPSFHEDK
jgi:hypothetical protein